MKKSGSSRNLVDFPDLVGRRIAEQAGHHTQLLLRQLCHQTKFWTNHINVKNRKETENPFPLINVSSYLLTGGLPTVTCYLIENERNGPSFFAQEGIAQFLKRFGSKIRKIRVKRFHSCGTLAEFNFYQELKNLKELEIDTVIMNQSKMRVPENFQQLTSLKIDKMQVTDPRQFHNDVWELFQCCRSVEILRVPKFVDLCCPVIFRGGGIIGRIVDQVKKKVQAGHPVKSVDLQNVISESMMLEGFRLRELLSVCAANGIKVVNLDASLLVDFYYPALHQPYFVESYDRAVASLQNVSSAMRALRLSNLEEINVVSFNQSLIENQGSVPTYQGIRDDGVRIPNGEGSKLKKLAVNFDLCNKSCGDKCKLTGVANLNALMSYLFLDNERSGVEELSIRFSRGHSGNAVLSSKYFQSLIYRSITKRFVNLKKMELQGWDGDSKYFSRMWGKLEHLEEVSIDDCRTVGDNVFIGLEDEAGKEAVFRKLTKLKTLSLVKLNHMKITDRSFREVFQHMPIREFVLQSSVPLTKITKQGILDLACSTVFSKSVERFPFGDWSLEGISFSEFLKLRSMFKCNY